MKILVKGPALTRTGYGEHCRFVLRALREQEDLDLYLIPLNWGESAWVWENSEERDWFDSLVRKTALYNRQNPQYDASIQVTIPNEWQQLAPINIGVTAGIETDVISPTWIEKSRIINKIITISEHSKKGFVDSVYQGINNQNGQKAEFRCERPIEVVHYPVKKYDKEPQIDLDLPTKFNFLTVAQWGPRKNIFQTITWFVEEFIDNPEVGLVVKTFIRGGCLMDKQAVTEQLENMLKKYENRKCKVYLLHGDLTDEEMHSLYKNKSIKALVSLTHGEGFGLPLFEAAYSGLPILATDWSGHIDFLYKPTKNKQGKVKSRPHFAKVDYDLQPVSPDSVWEGVIEKHSKWAYPKQGSYKMKLREMYKENGRYKSQAKKLQKWILQNFEQQKQYDCFVDSIKEYLPSAEQKQWQKDLDEIEII